MTKETDEAKVNEENKSENEVMVTEKETPVSDHPPASKPVLDLVLPGDMIGTSEEFNPGDNTFKYGGNIYATITGVVSINQKNHSISVIPSTNVPPVIKEGDVVFGRVNDLKSSMALVEIGKIKGKGERAIVNLQQAAIHISNIKSTYVKDIVQEFSTFDIVKAKVIDLKTMRLTTSAKDLGVIKAYCSRCHADLIKQSSNGDGKIKLKCPVCGTFESRKVSTEYGACVV